MYGFANSFLADRPKIVRKERGLRPAWLHVVNADIETTQTLGKMPRDIGYGSAAPITIGIGQFPQQFRRRASERNFEVERERLFVDSCHAIMRTNKKR